jgi:hypothetical protein
VAPTFVVRSPAAGHRLIAGKVYTDNHRRSLRVRPHHRTAVLVPCAGTKPFSEAPSHKHGYLPALDGAAADVYVVAEPLGVVPWAWEDRYPNNAYDFPPAQLKGPGRALLVTRIREWFEAVGKKYDRIYLALPGHHGRLVREATSGLTLPLVDVSITACRSRRSCGTNIHRATSGSYRKYLSRAVHTGSAARAPGPLVGAVRAALSPELVDPSRCTPNGRATSCQCYHAAEALYHLLGGRRSGYVPVHGPSAVGTHWWLRHAQTGEILDPTGDQFPGGYRRYAEGTPGGFLTKGPSRRAKVVMARVRAGSAAQGRRALLVMHLDSLDAYTDTFGAPQAQALAARIGDAIDVALRAGEPVYIVTQDWGLTGIPPERPRRDLLRRLTSLEAETGQAVAWLTFDEDTTEWSRFLPRLRARLAKDGIGQVTVGGLWYDPSHRSGCATRVLLYLRKHLPTAVDESIVGCEDEG